MLSRCALLGLLPIVWACPACESPGCITDPGVRIALVGDTESSPLEITTDDGTESLTCTLEAAFECTTPTWTTVCGTPEGLRVGCALGEGRRSTWVATRRQPALMHVHIARGGTVLADRAIAPEFDVCGTGSATIDF